MNKEKIKHSLKKVRDFILCCRKTLDDVEDVIEEIDLQPTKIYNLGYMIDRKKSVFAWNHISNDLDYNHIKELKSYYQTYHKKCWAYKQTMKRFKKLKWLSNSASTVFASGGIASAAASGGIALIAVSSGALLIQAWMKHQNLDRKIHNCQYAYQSYDRLLIQIKDAMRSGNFEKDSLINSMTNTDNYVADNSPVVDKYLRNYNDNFIAEGYASEKVTLGDFYEKVIAGLTCLLHQTTFYW